MGWVEDEYQNRSRQTNSSESPSELQFQSREQRKWRELSAGLEQAWASGDPPWLRTAGRAQSRGRGRRRGCQPGPKFLVSGIRWLHDRLLTGNINP